MNKLLANLSQAKSNPHVFWAVAAAVAVRVGPQLLFKILDNYNPHLVGPNAATQDLLEPYLKDLSEALQGYAALAAANSGPSTPPPNQNPPATPPPTGNPT